MALPPPTTDSLRCPRCRSMHGFHAVTLQEDNDAGCLFFFLGGLIPYLIYSSRQSNLVECENCHLVFRPPAPPTDWRSMLLLLVVLITIGIIAYWWVHALD